MARRQLSVVIRPGTTCWHPVERYDYPTGANVVVHPYDWQANNGLNYGSREHTGRGYW
jgi:hypothetical protein